jgi:hypothetical protein
VDSETRNARRALIGGTIATLIGAVLFLVRVKFSTTAFGHWLCRWYCFSIQKSYRYGRGSYMIEVGEILSIALFFGGLGVAYIGFQHLRDRGHLNL